MAFTINDIKANFAFQGARPTLFNVLISSPRGVPLMDGVQFLASATTIPESQLGNIAVPYFGRIVNFAGDRSYNPWTVTIMNDEDFKVRNALETWSDLINGKISNVREVDNYKDAIATVTQYGKTGDIIRQYEFVGIYPSVIEPIGLNWRDINTFESFNVQFMYDYWRIRGNQTGTAGETG